MGAYGLAERTIAQMHRRSPGALREALWSDEWLQDGMEALHTRLKAAERDAVRLYFEALELVGGENERALIVFCVANGVQDPDQLRRLVDLAKQADGADQGTAYALAKRLVREHVLSDPQERRRVMQEIFGVMDATPPAELSNGNGNGHA